jgi:hypothetical protein
LFSRQIIIQNESVLNEFALVDQDWFRVDTMGLTLADGGDRVNALTQKTRLLSARYGTGLVLQVVVFAN